MHGDNWAACRCVKFRSNEKRTSRWSRSDRLNDASHRGNPGFKLHVVDGRPTEMPSHVHGVLHVHQVPGDSNRAANKPAGRIAISAPLRAVFHGIARNIPMDSRCRSGGDVQHRHGWLAILAGSLRQPPLGRRGRCSPRPRHSRIENRIVTRLRSVGALAPSDPVVISSCTPSSPRNPALGAYT